MSAAQTTFFGRPVPVLSGYEWDREPITSVERDLQLRDALHQVAYNLGYRGPAACAAEWLDGDGRVADREIVL